MILLLEDSPERVRWLHSIFGVSSTLVHCESATEFAEVYERHAGDALLVILDHDLGEEGTFAGAGGYGCAPVGNGMEAVRLMVSRPERPPVLVWSLNGPRRAEMVATLQGAGFTALDLPIVRSKPAIERVVREALGFEREGARGP